MEGADLAFAGVARQAELVRAGEVSARELTELYLERIERLDGDLNAFRVVMPERALAEADEADRRRGDTAGRLNGVPIAVKDALDVAEEFTGNGSRGHGGPAAADAELVRRLREAGAVIVGKTNVPELCAYGFTESEAFGITRNPWDRNRTPGGSSGGSAAAVAAGLVPAATASDGAGSIRIPAACCGLFGLKPQRGRISLAPDREHWHGLSVLGFETRSVLDTALLIDATAGSGTGDPEPPPPLRRPLAEAAGSRPERLRVAVSFKGGFPNKLDPEVRAAVEQTAELLRTLGHRTTEAEPDYGLVGTLQASPRYLRGVRDDARSLAHPERLERTTKQLAAMGALAPDWRMRQIRRAEAGHAQRLNRILADHDVVLQPVASGPAPEIGRWTGKAGPRAFLEMASYYPYTVAWNVTGQPAASVPAGFTEGGLPLAVQLVGRRNDEDTLVSLAAELEAERPWADRTPPA